MNACGDFDNVDSGKINSGKVDCDKALAEIYLLLDRECGPAREAEIRRHLDTCPPCLEEYGIDEHLKQLLARKCGGDHAPDDLKSRRRAKFRSLGVYA